MFERFVHHDMVASGLLLIATAAALLVVNLGYGEWYHSFWNRSFGFSLGAEGFEKSLHHWVNDGLMSIFFFIVGLEIKRELLAGELASWRKAVLPAAAAVGGMLVPALVYALFNFRGEGANGWGIPMATDIAFAAGCLTLLKRRIAPALLVFLVALAIVDDLGAVAVIAVFYTDSIQLIPLLLGGALIAFSFLLGLAGVRSVVPYVLIGIFVWLDFVQSGVHATVAGVLLAFTIPHKAQYETHNFTDRIRQLLGRFDKAEELWPNQPPRIHDVMVNSRQQSLLRHMGTEIHHVEAPLQRIEHNLHPFGLFFVMPVFAFANAGVHLEFGHMAEIIREPVALGVVFGLAVGKPIGILLASFLAVKSGVASLPNGVEWKHVFGVGCLAGIGFTMSLFINELAFMGSGEMSEDLVAQGKLGIFLASFIAAVVGLLILRFTSKPQEGSAVESGQ